MRNLVFLAACLFVCGCAAPVIERTVVFAEDSDSCHYYRIPAMCLDKDGNIVAVIDRRYESLADLGYRDSLVREGWLAGNSIAEVMDTYLDRVVGDNVYNFYGRQFPVCVKQLRVRGRMPLRVHPDDETAIRNGVLLARQKKDVKLEKKYLAMMAQHGATEVDRASAKARLDALNSKK